MAKVIAKPNEKVENLIRRFKKKVDKDGTLRNIAKHEFYLSPSQRRKEKQKQASRLRARMEKKQQALQNSINKEK